MKIKQSVGVLLLICYIIAMLWLTLFTREYNHITHIAINPVHTYQLVIHSCINGYKQGGIHEMWKHLGWYKEVLSSIGLNILLFVPLGFLVPFEVPYFRNWLKVLTLGFLVSIIIETTQLVTHLDGLTHQIYYITHWDSSWVQYI